jgi:hypothetical protein
MNTVLVPRGGSLLIAPMLPNVPSPATPPLQSGHLSSIHAFLCQDHRPGNPAAHRGRRGSSSHAGYDRGFAQRSQARRTAWPNRVHFASLRASLRYGPLVHLRQLSTPCCHDAVAFGHRRVNEPPDGDFHPAVWAPSQAHERGHSAPVPGSRRRTVGARLALGFATRRARAPSPGRSARSPDRGYGP